MPVTEVRVFRDADADGASPFLEWLEKLEKRSPEVYRKCLHCILALHEHGHELRRPMADLLRDGVDELRAKQGRVHYRILYGFSGRHIAVLAHGATKKDVVDPKDIELAVRRLDLVRKDPAMHTMDFEIKD